VSFFTKYPNDKEGVTLYTVPNNCIRAYNSSFSCFLCLLSAAVQHMTYVKLCKCGSGASHYAEKHLCSDHHVKPNSTRRQNTWHLLHPLLPQTKHTQIDLHSRIINNSCTSAVTDNKFMKNQRFCYMTPCRLVVTNVSKDYTSIFRVKVFQEQ